MKDVTRILSEVEAGDSHAATALLPLVYDELRRLAAQRLAREKPGHTLQPTALVHEAYVRLVDVERVQHWSSRGHFFGAAAEAMRRILVENARHKLREKHGGGRRREHPSLDGLAARSSPREILLLHEALERLSVHDPSKAKLVELHFFGGLTVEQAAECLEISLSTANRAWRYARAWLSVEMRGGPARESGTAVTHSRAPRRTVDGG